MFAVSMTSSTEMRIGLGLKSLPTPTSTLPPTLAVTECPSFTVDGKRVPTCDLKGVCAAQGSKGKEQVLLKLFIGSSNTWVIVKAMVFPVVTHECESWTIKKAEHRRTDAFELWCWRRLLRVH